MKTRLHFFMLLMSFTFLSLNAQDPNGYCGIELQDSIDFAQNRFEATIFRIPDDKAPEIDGLMDKIWYCSTSPINMKQWSEEFPNPDPNLEVDVRFLYDSSWLYVAVNVLHDNEFLPDGDRCEVMFQNTWGGRKDGTYDHCNEANWWWHYWEQDGDKKWVMPASKDNVLKYDDQDINDACATPHPAAFGQEAPGWLTLGVLKQVLYEIDTTELPDKTTRITYEMAFHLRNWLKYDDFGGTTVPIEGHDFGFEISVRDIDASGSTGQFNMSDPSNNAWCSAVAISKLTFGAINENLDTCEAPVNICDADPKLCEYPSTGISSHKINKINIYPNPVRNILTIDTDSEISSIEISNIMGQVVLKNNSSENNIITTNLADGVYFIKVYSGNTVVGLQRFIKE